MAPVNVPELTPVTCSPVLCSVKQPVASAKRPVPPVQVRIVRSGGCGVS
jgi:hypothetical protein